MTRPNFDGIRQDVADYIVYLEEDTQQELEKRDERIAQLENSVADMKQMLQNLQRLYFGKKSEKIRIPALSDGAEQLSLFGQEECVVVPPAATSAEPEAVEAASHKHKKKRAQKEIIAALPVIVHDLTIQREDLRCPRCDNQELECIGKELAYTEYERIPAHMIKHEYYLYKYACRQCENGTEACNICDHAVLDTCEHCSDRPKLIVIAAKLPEALTHPLLKGSKASPSIVAQIYHDKFVQGVPLYRQEKEWERLGFSLTRQTMTNWILSVNAHHVQPVVEYMSRVIKEESLVIHCDETHVKVLQEKTATGSVKKCQMWVTRSGKYEDKQIVVFNFRTTRAGKEPTDILAAYHKYFVSDGYSGYNALGKDAIRCGCWAHVRRKFYDSIPDHNMDLPSTGREGVRFCDRLFRIEEGLVQVTPEERQRVRNDESSRVIQEFYAWLATLEPAHKSLKEAVTYAINQKTELLRFLDNAQIPISNNAAENAIRPFVVGRKSWLFCNSEEGACAAANGYSVVETAKANNLDPLKYLNFLLRHLPLADGVFSDVFFESLMPWNPGIRDKCVRGYN